MADHYKAIASHHTKLATLLAALGKKLLLAVVVVNLFEVRELPPAPASNS